MEDTAPTRPGAGPDAHRVSPSAVRLRAFVVALAIIPLDNYWVLMMEKVLSGPYPTTISIFANVVFVLAVLALANAILRHARPSWAFSQAEMLLIYTMVAVSAALAGHDLMPTLIGMMTYPFQFATVENQWAQKYLPLIPRWLTVSSPNVTTPLWEGNSSLYAPGIWQAWLKPAAWWVAFMTLLMFVMQCINTLVRKSWSEYERLPFPIVQLPLAMTEPQGDIWRNRLFWAGFTIPAVIVVLNGLAVYFPSIPTINVGFEGRNLAENLTSKPWSALGWTPFTLYPFVIGLGYLLRADLLFSCVFFYWFWKWQLVLTSAFALDGVRDFPFIREQAFGGYIAIVVTVLITSRGYFAKLWRHIIGQPSELDDSTEPISYRAAAVGALAGTAALSAFIAAIGMNPLLAVLAFVVYFAVSTSITRIRAELGPPVHDGHFSGPDGILPQSMGLNAFSNRDLVGLSYFWWFNRAFRCHPMPIGLEGMKMAESARASQSRFFWGVILAVAVGAVATFWAYLHIGYERGFNVGVSQGGVYASGQMTNLERWFARPHESLHPGVGPNLGILAGFAFCVFLWYMHLHIVGWPLHPIGFAITSSWAINIVWFPLLIAWAIKVSVLRFAGLQLYRRLLPFFLGLIVGEMVPGCVWSIIGIVFNIPYYSFWGQ